MAVGCFPIVCPAATLPIEGEASRGLLSWSCPLLLSPMERGASTLEERKFKYKNRIFFPAVAVACCCLRWERGASTLEGRELLPFLGLLLSLRLPSARIEAAVSCFRGRGLLPHRLPCCYPAHRGESRQRASFVSVACCCLRWERGASTLEERKFKYKNRIFFPAVAVRIFFPLKEERPLFLFRSLFLPVIRVKPKLYLFFLFFYFVIRYYS